MNLIYFKLILNSHKILLTSTKSVQYNYFVKNVTFKADEKILQKARIRAKEENTSLNEIFNNWLEVFVKNKQNAKDYDLLMKNLNYVSSGQKFSRSELNER